jgi:hypothetical protein
MINDASIVKIERQPTDILPTGGLGVPAGGSQGQVLAKSTNSNYDTAWVDPSIGVPAGGSMGQFLVKNTNTNYDTIWQDLPSIQSTEYLLQTVYNGSGSTINRGSIVSFVGGDGSYPIVEKAVSSSIHDSDVIGIALDNILNGEYGSIVVNGILDGFNTNAFNVGDKLYLSSVNDGAITNIVPTAPNHAIFIGFCIKKDAADGAIYINLNTGTHLDLLHDVSINLPSSGDVLFFNENNTWVNKKIDVYNVSGAVGSGDFKNIVFQTGNQNISGVKTFFHRPILSGSQIQSNQSGLAMLGEVVTINGSQTITGPKTFSASVAFSNSAIDYSYSEINFDTTDFNLDPYSSSGLASNLRGFFVDVDTNQIVNGRKTFKSGIKLISQNSYALNVSGSALFSERPTVNGTGVLLQGEVQDNTIISGVVYSAQVNVKNYNGSTIYKGQPVYIAGAEGGNILVKLASNVSEQSSSKTLGLVVQDSLDNNAFGTVITDGLLENFDVSVASAGDPIWLGPTGSLLYGLANKPHAPNHMVYLGVVTRAQNNGEVFVKVQNGYELDELHDVSINSPMSGQFLSRNNSNNAWINKTFSPSDFAPILNDATTYTLKSINGILTWVPG